MAASIRQLVYALATLFAVAACDSPRDRIAGKWEVQGSSTPTVWEFSKNGAVKSGNISGKYSFGSSTRLKIQTQFATFTYESEIKGDTMTWTDPKGARTELKKVQ